MKTESRLAVAQAWRGQGDWGVIAMEPLEEVTEHSKLTMVMTAQY